LRLALLGVALGARALRAARNAGWRWWLSVVFVGLAGVGGAWPFFSDNAMGTGEALNYHFAVADANAQLRSGEFPAFVGQTEFAYNGRVHPLRTAPYFAVLARTRRYLERPCAQRLVCPKPSHRLQPDAGGGDHLRHVALGHPVRSRPVRRACHGLQPRPSTPRRRLWHGPLHDRLLQPRSFLWRSERPSGPRSPGSVGAIS